MATPEQKQQALTLIVRASVAAERLTTFPAEITAAQSVLESDWLQREAGRFNYFGHKAIKGQPAALIHTKEWFTAQQVAKFLAAWEGRTAEPTGRTEGERHEYAVQDYFCVYGSVDESFTAHAHKLSGGNPQKPNLYYPAWKQYLADRNMDKLIYGIGGIYATAPQYASSLLKLAHDSLLTLPIQQERAKGEVS